MVAFRITDFAGMIPVRSARALPPPAATQATNLRLEAGGVQGIRQPGPVLKTAAVNTKSFYRLPTGTNVERFGELASSRFVEWTDEYTDVVRSPFVNDLFKRFYWVGSDTGVLYFQQQGLMGNSVPLQVGMPTPTVAPTVAAVAIPGDTSVPESRAYIYTWVNIYGEESAPSPPAEASGSPFAIWNIQWSAPTDQHPNPGFAGSAAQIYIVNIYRTNGEGTYAILTSQYIANYPTLASRIIYDTVPARVLQRSLVSTAYFPPKPRLKGLVSLPGGVMATWLDNTVYFSEPFHPHAWPDEYAITVEYPVVGLGVVGNILVVCTTGYPTIIAGSSPAEMAVQKIQAALPCLSRGSIISTPMGVIYASEPGLVVVNGAGVQVAVGGASDGSVTGGGIQVISDTLWGRDVWRREWSDGTLRAVYTEGYYVGVITTGATQRAFRFNPGNPAEGITMVTLPSDNTRLNIDPWSGKVLALSDRSIQQMFDTDEDPYPWTWRSQEFTLDKPKNIGVYELFFEPQSPDDGIAVKIWAGRRLVYDQTVTQPGKVYRLPTGFRSDIWQFELSGSCPLYRFDVGSTVQDLRKL